MQNKVHRQIRNLQTVIQSKLIFGTHTNTHKEIQSGDGVDQCSFNAI